MVVSVDDYDMAEMSGIGGMYETHVDRAIRQARRLGWEHAGIIPGYDAEGEPIEVHTFQWNSAILDHSILWDMSLSLLREAM